MVPVLANDHTQYLITMQTINTTENKHEQKKKKKKGKMSVQKSLRFGHVLRLNSLKVSFKIAAD